MWLTFLSNSIIFITAVILSRSLHRESGRTYFYWFVLLTGVGSFVAAFGHLTIIPLKLQSGLLFFSRIINIITVFCFASGIISKFYERKYSWFAISNILLAAVFFVWLCLNNVFLPILFYGVFGIGIISLGLLLKNYSHNKSAYMLVILGIAVLVLSSLTLSLSTDPIIRMDLSHLLVAISLVIMTKGFKQMKYAEIEA